MALAFATGGLIGQVTAPRPEDRFLVINGAEVRYADFYRALEDYSGREVAERLAVETALAQEARRTGLEPSDAAVDERLRELVAERFGGDLSLYAQWMASEAMTEDAVRRRVTNELRDLAVRSQGITPTEAELRAYFEANRAKRYDRPPTVKFRQIVLASRDEAVALLAKIKAGETDFFGAALNHSLDPQAKQTGGLVGPVPVPILEEQVPAVAAALAKLGVYQAADEPVEQDGRWVLLMLAERTEGKPRPFEQVAQTVRRDYLLEKAVPENVYYRDLMARTQVDEAPPRYQVLTHLFGGGREGE